MLAASTPLSLILPSLCSPHPHSACTMNNQAIWRDRVPSTPVSGYCYYVYRRASSSRICVRVWSLKKASTMKQASGIRTPRLFFIFFLSFFPLWILFCKQLRLFTDSHTTLSLVLPPLPGLRCMWRRGSLSFFHFNQWLFYYVWFFICVLFYLCRSTHNEMEKNR